MDHSHESVPGRSDRGRVEDALRHAREEAFGSGEYVGQESFLSASEITHLARLAGIGPETRLLDLCAGTGGPAALLHASIGCDIVALDRSAPALDQARTRVCTVAPTCTRALAPTVVAADALHVPLRARFDTVMLLETMLSIPNKPGLLIEVARLLAPGGRFLLTLEAGEPLNAAERAQLPEGHAVWLIRVDDFIALLHESGFTVQHLADHTAAHAALAGRLAAVFARDHDAITRHLTPAHLDHILASHRCWATWLTLGRVRKLAVIATRSADHPAVERNGQDSVR